MLKLLFTDVSTSQSVLRSDWWLLLLLLGSSILKEGVWGASRRGPDTVEILWAKMTDFLMFLWKLLSKLW